MKLAILKRFSSVKCVALVTREEETGSLLAKISGIGSNAQCTVELVETETLDDMLDKVKDLALDMACRERDTLPSLEEEVDTDVGSGNRFSNGT